MKRLRYKNILVLGAGKSGCSAMEFLRKKGIASLSLYDQNPVMREDLMQMEEKGVRLFLGKEPDLTEESFDLAIISPGISLKAPLPAALQAAKVPIWGELELAALFVKAPIIGITGTNGKTTTTTLVGEIFKNAGLKTFVGGNIGRPLLEAVDGDYDYCIVEMSSFQLETIHKLRAKIAAYLNLTPDHLDRHGDMSGYLEAKGRLAVCQKKDDFTVLNYDDPSFKKLVTKLKSQTFFYSRQYPVYDGAFVRHKKEVVFIRSDDLNVRTEHIINTDEIKIPGPHNLENAMAAIIIAKLSGIENNIIEKTLKTFKGVEHRMEDVRVLSGVRYVNDSKATNPDSVLKALLSYGDNPIILLAGGRNKGSSFDSLAKAVQDKVKYLILMGEAAWEMEAAVKNIDYSSYRVVGNMEEGIALAQSIAEEGDIVLLSPANASFDAYKNYEERGEVFKDLVAKLKRRR